MVFTTRNRPFSYCMYRSVHSLVGFLRDTGQLTTIEDAGGPRFSDSDATLLPFMVDVPTLSLVSKCCHLASAISGFHHPH